VVEHLGGKNATLLNGRALKQPEPIAPGDLILASNTRLGVEGFVFWHDAAAEHVLRNLGGSSIDLFELELIR